MNVQNFHLIVEGIHMAKHKLIAVDLAKNIFQVCLLNRAHKVVTNKSMPRADLKVFIQQQEPTTVAMEACYSSHYWARTFQAMGHKVLLIPAQFVKPFVRGNKSDSNDAVAIAEAALRPNLKPVTVKTIEQQNIQCLHRIRSRYVAQRTGLVNQTRGLLSEYGIIAGMGLSAFQILLNDLCRNDSQGLCPSIIQELKVIYDDYHQLTENIDRITSKLSKISRDTEACRILGSIPGIGPINATALYSAINYGQQFDNGRELAVWLGLTPKQSSSGERMSSSGITKRGDRYLRKQLVHGARAAISRCRNKTDSLSLWANQLVARRGIQKATVAMAARMARIAWVLLNKREMYQAC